MFVIIKYDLVMHFFPPPVVLKEDMLRPTLAQSRVRRVTVTEAAFATKTSCQFITGGSSQFPQQLAAAAEFREPSRHVSGFSRLTLAFAAAT